MAGLLSLSTAAGEGAWEGRGFPVAGDLKMK